MQIETRLAKHRDEMFRCNENSICLVLGKIDEGIEPAGMTKMYKKVHAAIRAIPIIKKSTKEPPKKHKRLVIADRRIYERNIRTVNIAIVANAEDRTLFSEFFVIYGLGGNLDLNHGQYDSSNTFNIEDSIFQHVTSFTQSLTGLLLLGQGLNIDLKKAVTVNVIERGSDIQPRKGPTSLVDSLNLFHTG
ncbi:hypothetical protein M5K25_028062 [Dendrobium thyrsiflorum]|uniref:Large ribosomal subunit protein uL18 C-terminal eukaryotes domain-containing protein n=1 Tax=Dendrobium thyrsiflorum TaxID=117978 RepID=A0ABD0TVG5_DENTH